MDLEAFIKYLIERKDRLVQQERMAIGKAKLSINAQIQVIESILIFVNRNKTNREATMEELELSLSEAISIEEIRSRQRRRSGGSSVVQAILRIIKVIPEGKGKLVDVPGYNKRTVASTVHKLSKSGVLPSNITIMTAAGGKEVYVVKEKVEVK